MASAAVFTAVAGNDPEPAAFRAANSRRPFLKREHEQQTHPAEEEAHQSPDSTSGTGEGIATCQQKTTERTGHRGKENHRNVAGNQTVGRHFEPCRSRNVKPAVLQIIKKQGFLFTSL